MYISYINQCNSSIVAFIILIKPKPIVSYSILIDHPKEVLSLPIQTVLLDLQTFTPFASIHMRFVKVAYLPALSTTPAVEVACPVCAEFLEMFGKGWNVSCEVRLSNDLAIFCLYQGRDNQYCCNEEDEAPRTKLKRKDRDHSGKSIILLLDLVGCRRGCLTGGAY